MRNNIVNCEFPRQLSTLFNKHVKILKAGQNGISRNNKRSPLLYFSHKFSYFITYFAHCRAEGC